MLMKPQSGKAVLLKRAFSSRNSTPGGVLAVIIPNQMRSYVNYNSEANALAALRKDFWDMIAWKSDVMH